MTEGFDLLKPEPKERYSKTIESGTWQTNKNFTGKKSDCCYREIMTLSIEKDGISDIESFVAKWELDEQWLFCIGKFIQITLKKSKVTFSVKSGFSQLQ